MVDVVAGAAGGEVEEGFVVIGEGGRHLVAGDAALEGVDNGIVLGLGLVEGLALALEVVVALAEAVFVEEKLAEGVGFDCGLRISDCGLGIAVG